jgi:hypothetical protein
MVDLVLAAAAAFYITPVEREQRYPPGKRR